MVGWLDIRLLFRLPATKKRKSHDDDDDDDDDGDGDDVKPSLFCFLKSKQTDSYICRPDHRSIVPSITKDSLSVASLTSYAHAAMLPRYQLPQASASLAAMTPGYASPA